MKKNILILLMSFISIGLFAQKTEPIKIYLKSGDSIVDMRGRVTKKYLEYKKSINSKKIRLKYDKINYVIIDKGMHGLLKVKFFKEENKKRKWIGLEPISVGSLELYKSIYGYGLEDFDNRTYPYYIKSNREIEVKLVRNCLFNKSKTEELILSYIKNCNLLVSKIKKGELNICDNLDTIIQTYNIICVN